MLLRQVLIGLLTNACKNTPAPGTVTLRGSRGEGGAVTIEVEDTGKGIPAEEQDRVFERFYRGSGALESEGFGLGLSIAKRMVDVMGGEIGLRSDAGQGHHLLGAPAAAPSRPRPRWPERGRDPHQHRPHPRRRRRAVGARVGRLRARAGGLRRDPRRRTARTPRASSTGDDFDLLILDIMMPGKSGLDICREVRAESPVPIILLTAKDAEVDKVVGPRGRRRRLRDQAVLGPRAARPGARAAAPPRARPHRRRRGRRRSSRARSRSTSPATWSPSAASRST